MHPNGSIPPEHFRYSPLSVREEGPLRVPLRKPEIGAAGHGFTVTATEARVFGVAKPAGWVTEMVVEPVALGVKTPVVFVLVPTGIVRDEGKVPTAGLVFPKFTVRIDAAF